MEQCHSDISRTVHENLSVVVMSSRVFKNIPLQGDGDNWSKALSLLILSESQMIKKSSIELPLSLS